MNLDGICQYRIHPSILRKGLAIVLSCLLAWSPVTANASQSPFVTTKQARHGDLSAFTKWTRLMPRYNIAKAEAAACKGDECDDKKWNAMLEEAKKKGPLERLDVVNRFFNEVTFVDDRVNYGQEDYWATPYELMKRGGDCEDYSIAKYISLKRLGVPESAMRIVILQDNNLGGIMHAVLHVRVSGKNYILDNQSSSVTAEEDIFHYRPIYAINRSAWWTYQ